MWRERADLADKVEQLETDLVRFRELEALLRTTLVSAERASADMKEQARREAELILSEAHAEARAVQRRALSENERLITETRLLRERLRTVLDLVENVEETLHGREPRAVPAAQSEAAEASLATPTSARAGLPRARSALPDSHARFR